MGNSNEKNSNYENAVMAFSDKEKEQLKVIYQNVCGDQGKVQSLNLNKQTQPYLPPEISQNMYLYMLAMEGGSATSVSKEGFVIAVCHGLKGALEDKAALLICMAGGAQSNQPTLGQMIQLVRALYDGYIQLLGRTAALATWSFEDGGEDREKLSAVLVQGLIAPDGRLQCENGDLDPTSRYTCDQVEHWLGRSALVLTMFDSVLHACFPVSYTDEVGQPTLPKFPLCSGVNWSQCQSMLSLPTLVYLNSRIPHDLRNQWHLLFTSHSHGESFSTLYKRIINQGPTILVVRDTKGHIFGGFAAESWTANSKFYGTPQCFLFGIHQVLEAYYPTSYNDNYMYFNHSQETLPNGLGMGGQFDYYGLWISDEFSRGQSRAEPRCSTYGSPQLSAEPHFDLAALEVWRVGPEPKVKGDGKDAAGSILDKDPAAKALLSLIDKAPHSEGLREGDATADIPEDRELYPEHGTL